MTKDLQDFNKAYEKLTEHSDVLDITAMENPQVIVVLRDRLQSLMTEATRIGDIDTGKRIFDVAQRCVDLCKRSESALQELQSQCSIPPEVLSKINKIKSMQSSYESLVQKFNKLGYK